MDDLPQAQQSQPPVANPVPAPPPSITMGGKEGEVASVAPPELPLKAVAQEVVLPKEVASHGVSATPHTITLPLPLIQAGVQAVGAHASVHPIASTGIHLPLTDDEIAKALHASVTTSVRWLAEWCVRQIKMVHSTVSNSH